MQTLTIPIRRNERQTSHEDEIAREIGALRAALAASLAQCRELERQLANISDPRH